MFFSSDMLIIVMKSKVLCYLFKWSADYYAIPKLYEFKPKVTVFILAFFGSKDCV